MADLSRLIQNAFGGRAVLFAGQELNPGSSSRLLQALSAHTVVSSSASVESVCASISDPKLIEFAAKTSNESGSSVPLRRVADIPWAAVFTSAMDDALSSELANRDSQSRRIRHLFLNDEMPAFFPRRNEVLTMVHLCHLADEQSITGVPLSGRNWGKATRLLIPRLLGGLAESIGPAHLLCIAGVKRGDPVDPLLLADSVSNLDPDNVYWFVRPDDQLDVAELRLAAPDIHIVESDFTDSLASYLDSAKSQAELSELKNQTLQLHDLIVTVGVGEMERVLSFRASEVREFRRHLLIVPDLKAKAASSGSIERKHDFVRFLSASRETPDWSGISEGFAFQRDGYKHLLEIVLHRVRLIAGSGQRSQSKARAEEDHPIFLAGPPASGRTVGLSWLAYELRRRGIFVVHLLSSGGAIDNASVEQILRLAEGRGAPSAVVLLDKSDRKVAEQLDRQLRSAGRRSVVVASVAPAMARRAQNLAVDLDDEPEGMGGTEVNLAYALTASETTRFRSYLLENVKDIDPELVLRYLDSDPAVFALLYRLIPDTRANIRGVVIEEYLALVEGLATFNPPTGESVRGSTMEEQLAKWLQANKPVRAAAEDQGDGPSKSPWKNIATHLPQLVLLFSSLDEPISLNLLTKRFPGLLQVYRALRETLEASGLFQEVELDKQNDLGLSVVNPFVAQLLLNATMPLSVARIRLLGTLLKEFPWDPTRRPVDLPEQALLVHVLRSIAPPSGAFQADYQRTEDLQALAKLLSALREESDAALPQLLLTEGIVLRHLGRRSGDDGRIDNSVAFYRESRQVLELAREILGRRKASAGRNFEMSMVLNAIASTIGHVFIAEKGGHSLDEAERKALVQQALDTASESRAYTDAYHPLDTAFWTSRDFFRHLSEVPYTEQGRLDREQALLNMADAIDKAKELGQLPHDQADRLGGRVVELAAYLHNDGLAELRAEEDAKAGRFSGVCLLARMNAVNRETGGFISTTAARTSLTRLDRYAPQILTDDRALTLMHRLWIGAHLGNRDVDDRPYGIASTQQDWQKLEIIVRGRRELLGQTRVPYVNFWLSVALAHLGDTRRALQMTEEVQANSLAFGKRRLAPLIYLADEAGTPKKLAAIVRRRDDDDLLTIFVHSLGIEVKIPKRYQGAPVMNNLQRGDELTTLVAFNYWNPMGIGPAWADTNKSESTSAGS